MGEGWKVYQTSNEENELRMLVIWSTKNPEDYLEPGFEIETDCWLSDLLKCANEEILVVRNW